jgi:hypothetical protein
MELLVKKLLLFDFVLRYHINQLSTKRFRGTE